jgi:hypothetical protein
VKLVELNLQSTKRKKNGKMCLPEVALHFLESSIKDTSRII